MVVAGEVVPVLCFSMLQEENSQQIHNYFLLFLHFFNQASQKLVIRTEIVFLTFLCCFGWKMSACDEEPGRLLDSLRT